jgi:hypothetical protein
MSNTIYISDLRIHVLEMENHLLEIEKDLSEVEHPELFIPYLKLQIKENKLIILLCTMKKDNNKTLSNMIREKLKQCITDKMEIATELVEIEAINENEYLEMSKDLKEFYDQCV